MCSKVRESRFAPATCMPPLWAKALEPTYGWLGLGLTLQSSSTRWATSVRRASRSGSMQS